MGTEPSSVRRRARAILAGSWRRGLLLRPLVDEPLRLIGFARLTYVYRLLMLAAGTAFLRGTTPISRTMTLVIAATAVYDMGAILLLSSKVHAPRLTSSRAFVVDYSVTVAQNVACVAALERGALFEPGSDFLWTSYIACTALWTSLFGRSLGVGIVAMGVPIQLAMAEVNASGLGNGAVSQIVGRELFALAGVLVAVGVLGQLRRLEASVRDEALARGRIRALDAMHLHALQALTDIGQMAAGRSETSRLHEAVDRLQFDLRHWNEEDRVSSDLHTRLRDIVHETQGRLSETQVYFEPGDCRHSLPAVVVDRVLEAVTVALDNLKHAHASTVTLTCRPASGVRISIFDDGVGFDPSSVVGGRVGLGQIERALAEAGGHASLQSWPAVGTRWVFRIEGDG